MRQPFLLGAFVYVALVAGRISNGNGLKTAKDGVAFRNGPQGVKSHEIATVNPIVRSKRVTNDPEDITFWANRGRRSGSQRLFQTSSLQDPLQEMDYVESFPEWMSETQEDVVAENKGKRTSDDITTINTPDRIDKDCPTGCNLRSRREEVSEPFWGTRGKRNDETNIFWGNRGKKNDDGPFWGNRGKKESDNRYKKIPEEYPFWGNRGKRDDGPFWGNRGRRSGEMPDFNPFWGNRGKKDDAEPFWGNRGKKNEIEPFWGNRGKKDDFEPFWGNRGKKDDMEPFWGNRGKKDDMEPFWGNRGKKDDMEPFWGNRGKKDDMEPFWGNRGKRDDMEPFWGNRGKKDDMEPFWGNRGKKDDFEPFWGNRGKKDDLEPFWGNRGKKDDFEPFWGNRGKKDDMEPFWGNRGKKNEMEPFWGNRGKRYFFNHDFYTNPRFLELVDKSKCFSKYLNNIMDKERGYAISNPHKLYSNKFGKLADPKESDDSKSVVHLQEPFDFSDNVLVYSKDDTKGIPKTIMK